MTSSTRRELRTALHRLGLERDRLNRALARAAGLAPSDLAALEHIEFAGQIDQRRLAERLSLTPGSVSILVDRLERAGLCRRTADPADARRSVLELTERAGALARRHGVAEYEAAVERAAASLTASERAAAARFLASAADAAEGLAAGL